MSKSRPLDDTSTTQPIPLPNSILPMIMSDDESDDNNGEDRYSADYHAKMQAKRQDEDTNHSSDHGMPKDDIYGEQARFANAMQPPKDWSAPATASSNSIKILSVETLGQSRRVQSRRYTIDIDDTKKGNRVAQQSAPTAKTTTACNTSSSLLQSPTQLRQMLNNPQAPCTRPMFGIAQTISHTAGPKSSTARAGRAGSEPREHKHKDPPNATAAVACAYDDDDDDNDDDEDGSLLVPLPNQRGRRPHSDLSSRKVPPLKKTSKLSSLRTAMDKHYRAQQSKQPTKPRGRPPGLTKDVIAARKKAAETEAAAVVANVEATAAAALPVKKVEGAAVKAEAAVKTVAATKVDAAAKAQAEPMKNTPSDIVSTSGYKKPDNPAPAIVGIAERIKNGRRRKTIHQPLVDDSEWSMDIEDSAEPLSPPPQCRSKKIKTDKPASTIMPNQTAAREPTAEIQAVAKMQIELTAATNGTGAAAAAETTAIADSDRILGDLDAWIEMQPVSVRKRLQVVRAIPNPNGDMIKKVAFLRTVINYMLVVLDRPQIEIKRGMTFKQMRRLYRD